MPGNKKEFHQWSRNSVKFKKNRNQTKDHIDKENYCQKHMPEANVEMGAMGHGSSTGRKLASRMFPALSWACSEQPAAKVLICPPKQQLKCV